jgi:hypothetical protein
MAGGVAAPPGISLDDEATSVFLTLNCAKIAFA